MSDEQPAGERTLLVPPVWALVFFVCIGIVGRALPGRWPLPQKSLAILLAAAGLGIAIWALVQFRRDRTTYKPHVPGAASALVTDGVYRFTRNPMYVGMALILFGEAFWFGSLIGFLLVLVFIGIITAVQIVPEERALKRLFGEEFEAFKRRTPRWLLF
ncbi:MAG: isoprenylcysteine carboxylmethyltransferase family protein [Parvularcula sp.]|jgi:protein-S-isoprenylcysteine O-methyltransferase Ste14|nr:isoprenylcysteine carboxylmethyltransferase family protein [Parvularcula sp.]